MPLQRSDRVGCREHDAARARRAARAASTSTAAAQPWRASAGGVRVAAADGHEQRAAAGPARVHRDTRDGVAAAPRDERAQPGIAPAVVAITRSASRATRRSSNGIVRPASSWPCSWPLPAITTTSPASAPRQRGGSRAPVGLDHPRGRSMPGQDLGDDRVRILAARVVGRDDHAVGELLGHRAHQRALGAIAVAAAAEDDDAGGRASARAPCAAPSRARPACARSRPAP